MKIKNIGKKGVFTGAIAIAMLAGVLGGQLMNVNKSNAQTVTVPPANTGNSGGNGNNSLPNGGTFHSNEDPSHEAKESAQWEAQENAGQAPWQHNAKPPNSAGQ